MTNTPPGRWRRVRRAACRAPAGIARGLARAVWRAARSPATWLGLLSAVLLRLSYPVPGLFPLAWVALVPWLVVVRTGSRRTALWGSVVMGMVAAGLGLSWQYIVTVLGGIGLTIYVGLYFILFAVLARAAHRHLRVPFVVAAPALWVGCEYLRSWLLTGFPWLFVGHTQQPWNSLVQVCDLFGVYAVSFTVLACNALVTEAVLSCRRRPVPWRGLAAGGAFVLAMACGSVGYGLWRLAHLERRAGPLVGVVQANIPQDIKNELTLWTICQIFARHWRTTYELRDLAREERFDLIVWPESMVQLPLNQPPPEDDSEFRYYMERAAKENGLGLPEGVRADPGSLLAWLAPQMGCPILVGAHAKIGYEEVVAETDGVVERVTDREIVIGSVAYQIPDFKDQVSGLTPKRQVVVRAGQRVRPRDPLLRYETLVFNSAYLFRPIALLRWLIERYDKIHLVPFGEYVPLRSLLWFLMPVAANARGFDSADRATQFQIGESRFGVLICFEDAFPRVVRRFVVPRDGGPGADFLVNISNDGWFRDSHELDQHLAITTFRAIEFRTGIVRCTNTGISAIIGPDGRIQTRVRDARGRFREVRGVAAGRVQLRTGLTFYARHGDAFAQVCLGFAAAAVALGAGRWIADHVRRRTRRHRPGSPPAHRRS